MKRKWKKLAAAASALMAVTLAMPASAATPTVGYYNGHKYTVTASKNGAVARGTIDYEADSYSPAVSIWGTRIGDKGSAVSIPIQWGTYSVSFVNPYGNVIKVVAEGFINGTSVGIASTN